jgi:hypothetical protein
MAGDTARTIFSFTPTLPNEALCRLHRLWLVSSHPLDCSSHRNHAGMRGSWAVASCVPWLTVDFVERSLLSTFPPQAGTSPVAHRVGVCVPTSGFAQTMIHSLTHVSSCVLSYSLPTEYYAGFFKYTLTMFPLNLLTLNMTQRDAIEREAKHYRHIDSVR